MILFWKEVTIWFLPIQGSAGVAYHLIPSHFEARALELIAWEWACGWECEKLFPVTATRARRVCRTASQVRLVGGVGRSFVERTAASSQPSGGLRRRTGSRRGTDAEVAAAARVRRRIQRSRPRRLHCQQIVRYQWHNTDLRTIITGRRLKARNMDITVAAEIRPLLTETTTSSANVMGEKQEEMFNWLFLSKK